MRSKIRVELPKKCPEENSAVSFPIFTRILSWHSQHSRFLHHKWPELIFRIFDSLFSSSPIKCSRVNKHGTCAEQCKATGISNAQTKHLVNANLSMEIHLTPCFLTKDALYPFYSRWKQKSNPPWWIEKWDWIKLEQLLFILLFSPSAFQCAFDPLAQKGMLSLPDRCFCLFLLLACLCSWSLPHPPSLPAGASLCVCDPCLCWMQHKAGDGNPSRALSAELSAQQLGCQDSHSNALHHH